MAKMKGSKATADKNSRAELRLGTTLSTVSAPSGPLPPARTTRGAPQVAALEEKQADTELLTRKRPFNSNKASEIGSTTRGRATASPAEGEHTAASSILTTGSTVTETIPSAKVGKGAPRAGVNPGNGPLDRERVDSGGQTLTTNQGVPIADNQSSLKAGLRGPTLLEDFILREKITHFDHERIPERVVHARGSGAHGYFECTTTLSGVTRAAPFAEVGKRTPVFVRFSTVAGERGSADTVRDVRGFATKFYSEEGNWDLVGNNIPVFFIQDAMKFPDVVHAVKPEPHFAMPQASSAHDTFYDFLSLTPESTHMLMWIMSDRAIPRSYRMMQGFGVHTFRFINSKGDGTFVKFHWQPRLGTHSLVWDEAAKAAGADPDFHRRDLWEAIEAGAFPEWDLGVQLFSEEQADAFSFDVLDATKLIPEELVPVQTVGKLVLNRNPDNFFAETEQVAFCTANLIPGIDTSNDPLLTGRHFSYLDTQLSRLGGPNFHELPINAPLAPQHNNQRDGHQRHAVNRGRVNYEPSSLGGGCPFQAGMRGFTSFPQPVREDKVRGKPEKFSDHYTQARLFWRSQSPVEQRHIIAALRFELARVQTQAIRERVISMVRNVDEALATRVAEGLGMETPPAMPPVSNRRVKPEVERSDALSLFSRPGEEGATTRKVAILVADGAELGPLLEVHAALTRAGAVPRFVGAKLGRIEGANGEVLDAESTVEATPSIGYDAVVIPDGAADQTLARIGPVLDFVREQYRHCKAILVLGEGGARLSQAAGIPGDAHDSGYVTATSAAGVKPFLAALEKHRAYERETDPPRV